MKSVPESQNSGIMSKRQTDRLRRVCWTIAGWLGSKQQLCWNNAHCKKTGWQLVRQLLHQTVDCPDYQHGFSFFCHTFWVYPFCFTRSTVVTARPAAVWCPHRVQRWALCESPRVPIPMAFVVRSSDTSLLQMIVSCMPPVLQPIKWAFHLHVRYQRLDKPELKTHWGQEKQWRLASTVPVGVSMDTVGIAGCQNTIDSSKM